MIPSPKKLLRSSVRALTMVGATALLLTGVTTSATHNFVQPRVAQAAVVPEGTVLLPPNTQTFVADDDYDLPEVDVDGFTIVNPPKPKPKKKKVVLYKATEVPVSASIAVEQAYARTQASSVYGWGEDEFACIVQLWNKESGWNMYAENTSSGAYGIPQALPGNKMATIASDWKTNYKTQIRWGLWYFANASYHTPCNAWAHSQAKGWY